MKKRLTTLEKDIRANGLPQANISGADVLALVAEIRRLRKMLAMKTAECVWVEGGDFAKINAEVKQWGYRLVAMPNGHDPKMEEIK